VILEQKWFIILLQFLLIVFVHLIFSSLCDGSAVGVAIKALIQNSEEPFFSFGSRAIRKYWGREYI